MTNAGPLDDLRDDTRAAWHRYIDVLVPVRPALHAYCRRLTGDTWDAEDLVQDTMLRGFATLGSVHQPVGTPLAYLCRIATNLWIDAGRRRQREVTAVARLNQEPVELPPDPADIHEAAAALFERLTPHERAAVVMKDVLDMSLKEIAAALGTSVNAVKASLHRGRKRAAEATDRRRQRASPALVDRFVDRMNTADLDGMLALMLDTATIEMPGALVEVGREQFTREGSWLWQSVFVHPDMPKELRPPRWVNARAMFGGEPVMLSFSPEPQLLTCVTRFEEAEGQISRICAYQFSPETVAEVGEALGLATARLPYRFPTPAPGKSWS